MKQKHWFTYHIEESDIFVSVTQKRMRSLRLSVKPSGDVHCSVPFFTRKQTAIDFITARKQWIEHAVKKVARTAAQQQELQKDGVACARGLSTADKTPAYSAAWKAVAREVFSESATRQKARFEAGQIPSFSLKGRAMKTLWGSCNRRTNTVTLNWELLNKPQACIDYVVLHELVHFIHLHHDRAFYACVSAFMGDYKERIRLLTAAVPDPDLHT